MKFKVMYCRCNTVIIAGQELQRAEEEPKWIEYFQYYGEQGYAIEVVDGPVAVGYCSTCRQGLDPDRRRQPKSKEQLSKSMTDPAKVNETGPMATSAQKAEILLLLNSEVITPIEKSKMVAGINTIDRSRADKAIEKLKQAIRERNSDKSIPA